MHVHIAIMSSWEKDDKMYNTPNAATNMQVVFLYFFFSVALRRLSSESTGLKESKIKIEIEKIMCRGIPTLSLVTANKKQNKSAMEHKKQISADFK